MRFFLLMALFHFLIFPFIIFGQGNGEISTFSSNKPNYLIGWNNPDTEQEELKFQFSVKAIVFRSLPLGLSYTQVCDWKYGAPSSPIRTCDYSPAVFLGWEGKHWAFSFGQEHQSNGEGSSFDDQGLPISRSWRRDYADLELRGDWWAIGYQTWSGSRKVNNENIDDYYGLQESRLRIFYDDAIDLRAVWRNGDKYGYRIVELFSKPADWFNFHLYAQWFKGQGQYLLDIVPDGYKPVKYDQIMVGFAFTK